MVGVSNRFEVQVARMNEWHDHEPGDSDDTPSEPNRPRWPNIPRPQVSNYRFIKPIGRGAFGTVWLVEETMARTFRAAKILDRSPGENSGRARREIDAIREYQKVAKEHPHLVRIVNSGFCAIPGSVATDHETAYYVMEIADHAGGPQPHRPQDYKPLTLASMLKRSGRLPINTADGGRRWFGRPNGPMIGVVEFARALLDAIEHLHRAELFHRDVKPSNILVVNGEVKLGDLGLVSSDNAGHVGTVGYMTPDSRRADDLYAFGKVVYEMTTALPATSFAEWPGDLDPAGDAKSGTPAEPRLKPLRRLINDLCHPTGELRLNDVREIRRRLLEISSTGQSAIRTTRRQAFLVVATAVVLGLILGGWGVKWRYDLQDPTKHPLGRAPYNGAEITEIRNYDGAQVHMARRHLPGEVYDLSDGDGTIVRLYDLQTRLSDTGIVVAGTFQIYQFEQTAVSGDVTRNDGPIHQIYLIAGDGADAVLVALMHCQSPRKPGYRGPFSRSIPIKTIKIMNVVGEYTPLYLSWSAHYTPLSAEEKWKNNILWGFHSLEIARLYKKPTEEAAVRLGPGESSSSLTGTARK